jgi:heme-degrading monooxygenase HmoA
VPTIVVTRLRLKNRSLLDDFFASAVALLEQAKGSPGILGSDVLADANDTWWTVTSWDTRPSMTTFVKTDPHFNTMSRLDGWCNEATFVDWDQSGPDLPDWQTAWRRLTSEGQKATLSQPTPAHETLAFPAPVTPS